MRARAKGDWGLELELGLGGCVVCDGFRCSGNGVGVESMDSYEARIYGEHGGGGAEW